MKKQLKQNGFADHEPQRLKLRDFSHEDPAWELGREKKRFNAFE